jgi:hypothetical protein
VQLHGRRMGLALRPLAMIKQYKYGKHPEAYSCKQKSSDYALFY